MNGSQSFKSEEWNSHEIRCGVQYKCGEDSWFVYRELRVDKPEKKGLNTKIDKTCAMQIKLRLTSLPFFTYLPIIHSPFVKQAG